MMKNTNLIFLFMYIITQGQETFSQEQAELPANPIPLSQEVQTTLQKIDLLEEGTETTLTTQQWEELKPWAERSEVYLKDLLTQTVPMNPSNAKDHLLRGIQDVVLKHAPKDTELLMRYVLNRAVKIIAKMDEYSDPNIPGVVTQQIRLLRQSIELALKYCKSDLEFIVAATQASSLNAKPVRHPYAQFGVDYATYMIQINESMLNAKAQYSVAYFLTGLLHVDLARDQNAAIFAPAIAKLKGFVDGTPATPHATDSINIEYLRVQRTAFFGALDYLATLKGKINVPNLFPIESIEEKPAPPVKIIDDNEEELRRKVEEIRLNNIINEGIKVAKAFDYGNETNEAIEDLFNAHASKLNVKQFLSLLNALDDYPYTDEFNTGNTHKRMLVKYLDIHKGILSIADALSVIKKFTYGSESNEYLYKYFLANYRDSNWSWANTESIIDAIRNYPYTDEYNSENTKKKILLRWKAR